MNKISVYLLAFFISLAGISINAQGRNSRVVITNGNGDDIFQHTIERGETVYAIATMYGVGVEDIYRLNPGSRDGIRAGETLKIPQRDVAIAPRKQKSSDSYLYHTIQARETLYSLSIRYSVPATRIIAANPGLSTSTFTIGRTIRIPATPIESLPTTEKKSVTKLIDYTIEKKETMYRICRKFNISAVELIRQNPALKNGVKAGMTIKIPVMAEETVTIEHPSLAAETQEESVVNALLSTPKSIQRVKSIKVALLLPFMAEEPTPSATTSRFIEYYEGMLLAIDSLRNEGCSINLSVYDTGNGTRKVKEILKEDALKEANLIIGAVQNEQIGPVADFASEHNIKYVIPFTSKNDDVLSNACVFQVNTPHSYLYSKAAQTGCELFGNDNFIFVKTPDKNQKNDFLKTFRSEMQQHQIPYKELVYDAETYATDIEALLDSTRRNVIMPTSGALEALNKVTPALRMLQETRPVLQLTLFGYPEWQTYMRECLEDFYALNTYIYSNFYADNLSPAVHDFYTKYKHWYSKTLINTFPKYGILGFDTGMFFFGAMQKYGANFEDNLDKIRYQSIQTGFDFHRVNNWGGFINTQLFIVHYQSDYTVTRTEIK